MRVDQERESGRRWALLVGAPAGGLGGIDQCITSMRALLGARDFHVEAVEGTAATYQAIKTAMDRLFDRMRPGDAAVFYYAGHGHRVWDPKQPKEAYPVLIPMDARKSTAGDPRIILGFDLDDWLRALVREFAWNGRANVTAILECCHSAGLVNGQGLTKDTRQRARDKAAVAIGKTTRSGARPSERLSSHPEAQIVRVVAAEAHGRAYRDVIKTVGGMTLALVRSLERHGHEPWAAIDLRMRAFVQGLGRGQCPGVEGRRERVPFSTEEHDLPSGLLPCVTVEDRVWFHPLGELSGAGPGDLYHLNPELSAPGGTTARLADCGMRLELLEEEGPRIGGEFCWARPLRRSTPPRVVVQSVVGREITKHLRRRMVEHGVAIDSPQAPGTSGPRMRSGAPAGGRDGSSVTLRVLKGGAELHDPWGMVVRWPRLPTADVLAGWAHHLDDLERWLNGATSPSPEFTRTFKLTWWATEAHAEARVVRRPFPQTHPCRPVPLPRRSTILVELQILCRPLLYLSVFRVEADRSVTLVTGDTAGGLPATRHQPARVYVDSHVNEVSATRALVAVVSTRPLPVHLLERAAPPVRGRPTHSMAVLLYRQGDRE